MSKFIEAKAVINAADKTGNVFDKIASKLKGVDKSAKALGSEGPKFTRDLQCWSGPRVAHRDIQCSEVGCLELGVERSAPGDRQGVDGASPSR
jgi:hypothetical protein